MKIHSVLVILVTMLAPVVALVAPLPANAYPDTHREDLVIDAPWRTVRSYLPVLFFAPDFETTGDGRLSRISLHNYDPDTQELQLIFTDSKGFSTSNPVEDAFPCEVSFIDTHGRNRAPIEDSESIEDFWHYIARVPTNCIGMGAQRGQPGVHFLKGSIHWVEKIPTSQGIFLEQPRHDYIFLRVVIASDGFEKFSPVDHLFDVHVHTIAEQTKWHGLHNPDAARKAFGGPVAMLMESAYALGMVDVQLNDANWKAFKNKIVTTDHNSFFSRPPMDAGTHPGHGPTSATDGKEGELRWYRENLGELGGEEVTVQGANGDPSGPNQLRMGSHLLSYGAPHLEGPWHGGEFLYLGEKNDISIAAAMTKMGSTDGFGYASHPESADFGWSRDYYDRAIGLWPFNSDSGERVIVQANGSEFVFKGLQVWNEHTGMRSRMDGELELSESHRFNGYGPVGSRQRFVAKANWRKAHERTYEAYKNLVKRGLRYAFAGRDGHSFIRKLYLSAGTDSHGDFNQSLSLPSTTMAEASEGAGWDLNALSATANAFGRLRTYTLTSQRYVRAGSEIPSNCPGYPFCDGARAAPTEYPLEDYKEGNTVVTDGPVGRFSADANCRFNSDIDRLIWHDQRCIWENHDGLIGGRGRFDGGNTLLAPVGNDDVLVNAQWIGKNDYLADDEGRRGSMTFIYTRVQPQGYASGEVSAPHAAARARSLHIMPLNEALNSPASVDFPHATAVLLEGRLGSADAETRFITNPMWSAPYRIEVTAPESCPLKPGELTITVEFGLSMNTLLPSGNSAPAASNLVHGVRKAMALVAAATSKRPGNVYRPEAPVFDTALDPSRYDGIRVHIKPLDSSGNSGSRSYLVSGSDARWQPVEVTNSFSPTLIQDAKYTTTNSTSIPCASAWDSGLRKSVTGRSAYAAIVHQIHDMHGNYLNPIAVAFTVNDRSRPGNSERDPLDATEPEVSNPPPAPAICKATEIKLCRQHGARCELSTATGVAKVAMCRWANTTDAESCKRVGGLWTTVNSRFARNHPGAVPVGDAAACITEARNLMRRID